MAGRGGNNRFAYVRAQTHGRKRLQERNAHPRSRLTFLPREAISIKIKISLDFVARISLVLELLSSRRRKKSTINGGIVEEAESIRYERIPKTPPSLISARMIFRCTNPRLLINTRIPLHKRGGRESSRPFRIQLGLPNGRPRLPRYNDSAGREEP